MSRERKDGLEFMALKYNVVDKRLELAISKKITPTENNLLTLIELGTIGARNARRLICSKAEFFLEDLSQQLGYKETDKIWKLLKGLHTKELIIRQSTRSKGREILGLNPEVFGQILIDKSFKEEKIRHLKLVPGHVDNSKQQPTNRPTTTDGSSVDHQQFGSNQPTNRRGVFIDPVETIGENPLLDPIKTFKTLKTELGRGESFTLFGKGTGPHAETLEEVQIEKQRQLEKLAQAEKKAR